MARPAGGPVAGTHPHPTRTRPRNDDMNRPLTNGQALAQLITRIEAQVGPLTPGIRHTVELEFWAGEIDHDEIVADALGSHAAGWR